MYGTIARMRVKPGALEGLKEYVTQAEGRSIPGYIDSRIYQMDSDPNQLWVVVAFEDKDSYLKNAGSPEQDADYRRMLAFLDGEPEWHDGEIVYKTS